MATNIKRKKSKIRGVIVPAAWGNDDTVLRVSIQTVTEDEYLVEQNQQGQELLALLNKEIEAEGKLRGRLDGKTVISINNYHVVVPAAVHGI